MFRDDLSAVTVYVNWSCYVIEFEVPWQTYSLLWVVFFFFFFFIFSHFYVGSMCLVRRLHLGLSFASSSDNRLSDKSFLMLSNHLRFGLTLLLFPGTSIPITLLPTYSSSLLFSKHAHTTSTYSPALSWIFLPLLSSL